MTRRHYLAWDSQLAFLSDQTSANIYTFPTSRFIVSYFSGGWMLMEVDGEWQLEYLKIFGSGDWPDREARCLMNYFWHLSQIFVCLQPPEFPAERDSSQAMADLAPRLTSSLINNGQSLVTGEYQPEIPGHSLQHTGWRTARPDLYHWLYQWQF